VTPRSRFIIDAAVWLCALSLLVPAGAAPVVAEGASAKGAVPASAQYRLHAGDEVSVSVTPQKEYECNGTVLSDGMLYLKNIGGIKATGLTIPELATQIAKILDQDLVNPKVTVALVHMAPPVDEAPKVVKMVRVTVVGAVGKTGPLELEEGTRLRKALDLCGGASKEADLTQVVIFHKDFTRTIVDISTDKRLGDPAHNRVLEEGDSVEVRALPPAPQVVLNPVRISGQVLNPGQFELKQGMTLDDLIVAAGKLTPLADYEHVEIHRAKQPVKFVNLLTQRSQSGQSQTVLEPGDEVNVPEYHNTILIVGAIQTPGPRPFTKGQKLRDFLLGSSDLTVFNPAAVNLSGAQVIRKGEKDPVKIDLGKVLKRPDDKGNVALQSGDILFIPPRKETGGRGGVLDFLNFLGPISFLFGRF
jgi:protein involved in polysaccharide export with SLBB domain